MSIEQELQILYEIITYELEVAVSSTQDLTEIFNKTLALIGMLFKVERASIMLLNESRTELVTQAEWSPDGKKFGLFKIKYGEGVAGWVVKHREAFFYNGKEGQGVFVPSPQGQMEIKTLLSLPMQTGNHVIGALNVGSLDARRTYSPAEISGLKLIASRAALAVENASLISSALLEKEKVANIVRYLGEGVITVDKDRNITLMNEAAQRITGWKNDEVTGKFCGEFFEGSSSQGSEKCRDHCPLLSLKRCRSRRKEITTEGVILTKSGKQKYVASSFSALVQDGELRGGIIVFRDITEEKRLQQLRSDLLAGFSHDLRTPLTAVKGHILTLLRLGAGMETAERRKSLQIVNSEVDRLTRSLDNLISLFRIQTDKLVLYKDYFDLKASLAKIVALFNPSASRHTLVFEAPAQDFKLWADRDKIEQVISNLLSNALKYSEGGRVLVTLEDLGTEVKVRVQDEGEGIPDGQWAELFKSYSRGAQAGQHKPGSGLGLFISKAIVTAHHGKIWAETLNPGVCFCFTLPKGGQ